MRFQRLGSSDLELSVVGFGTWEAGGDVWGPNESDQRVVDAIRAGLDAGINWVDTAEVYGRGVSEELVGRALRGRHGALAATKVAPRPEGSGFRPPDVRRACEGSLRRLGVDRIDLYQLHWTDDTTPLEDTWGAMAGLQDEGTVRCIGVSNFDRAQIEACEAIRHVDSLQPHFSMLHPGHGELISWCGERGTGVVAYGPLAYGLLTGAISADTEFEASDWRSGRRWKGEYYRALFAPGKIERSLAVVDELRRMAEGIGVTLAQLALAWTVHQPGVTSAIAGSRNPDHARGNARAADIGLDDATLAELDALVQLGPDYG